MAISPFLVTDGGPLGTLLLPRCWQVDSAFAAGHRHRSKE